MIGVDHIEPEIGDLGDHRRGFVQAIETPGNGEHNFVGRGEQIGQSGLAMLEAMSCETPVIASNLPGVRKVAENAGVLIEPNNLDALVDAVNKLSTNPNLCRKYAQEAGKKALQYNWDQHTQSLIRHYQQLCA